MLTKTQFMLTFKLNNEPINILTNQFSSRTNLNNKL